MNKLAKALRSDFTAVVPLKIAAEAVRRAGRGRDTILAHITPREAALLKQRGGSGTINPRTGLLEFQEEDDFYSPEMTSERAQYAEDVSGYEATQDYDALAGLGVYNRQQGTSEAPVQYSDGGDAGYYDQFTPADVQVAYPYRTAGPEYYAPGGALSRDRAALQRLDALEEQRNKEQKESPGAVRRALEYLGITPKEAIQGLGLAGTGLGGILTSRRAGEQARKLEQQLAPGARETLARGQQLTAQAERGELTPASQRRMDILRAQAAQRAARTGGVGAAQTAIQLESARQAELQRQATYGQSLQQIGDQSLRRALELSLKADQAGTEAAQKYFAALGQMVGGTRGLIGG
jgi:hypothetical protein